MPASDQNSKDDGLPELISSKLALAKLAQETHDLRVLLITSQGFSKRGTVAEVMEALAGAHQVMLFDQIQPNPELDFLDQLTSDFYAFRPQLIIALGGGSVMDAAKVLAQTLMQKGGTQGLLHQFFRQQQPWQWLPPVKLMTIPTTAGTGAEVTPFATVWDNQTHQKYSLAHPLMYPSMTLLIPELTLTLPWRDTLYTALDTVSHSLETLWNKNHTPTSCMHARQALKLVILNLPFVLENPSSLAGREQLQKASFLAGLAISINKTAVAHSISYPLTSHYGVPHGLACSFTLPAIIEFVKRKEIFETEDMLLIDQVYFWLLGLPIFSELQQYLNWPDVFALLPEMLSLGRAGNFMCDISTPDIKHILERSAQLSGLESKNESLFL